VILIPKTEFIAQTARACIENARFNEPASARVVGLLDDLTLKNAEARCIHWLLRQCPILYESAPFEIELDLPPKRIVAAELNITSETLSRMLAGLRGKQLIRTSGKTILVLNPRRLETLCASSSAKH
jgi:CRP-like cAMP-binding protein